jgi:predicted nuclease of predicted toxin-antitoxin system
MARIYANENFPKRVIESLRQLGHDVLTTHEAGKSNQAIPDEEVLAFAASENRAVLTFNRKDFIRLHQHNQHHSGIIVCTEDVEFEALANRIHEAIETLGHHLDTHLIRVNRPNFS